MEPPTPAQPPRPVSYVLSVFADPSFAKDVVKAVLSVIFFHRIFSPVIPVSRDLLDITLPAIDDVDLETLIDQRAEALVGESRGVGRGQVVCQFYEKQRRKAYFSFGKDEVVCWERWTLDVTLATPRTETDRVKVRQAMERSLSKTTMKIINLVNRDKAHIPPITTTESFPYQVLVNPKSDGYTQKVFPVFEQCCKQWPCLNKMSVGVQGSRPARQVF